MDNQFTKERIGFIGLGNVGMILSNHLINSGYSLIVHDKRKEPTNKLQEKGAKTAKGPKEIGENSAVIFLSLPHPKVSQEVILGKNGLLEGCSSGKIIIETSTISPNLALKFGNQCKKKGVNFIDAALAGGLERAKSARLVFMIGGEKNIVKKVWPLFEVLGEHIFHVGDISSGMTVKVVNNAISHVTMVAISEAVSVGVKAGLDPKMIYNILCHGSADSDILRRRYNGRVLKGYYENGMSIDHAYKDSELICELGRQMGVPMFVTNCAHAVYEWGKVDGLGNKDYAALIKLWEKLLNLKISGSEKNNDSRDDG